MWRGTSRTRETNDLVVDAATAHHTLDRGANFLVDLDGRHAARVDRRQIDRADAPWASV